MLRKGVFHAHSYPSPRDTVIIEPHPNVTESDSSFIFDRPIEARILRVEERQGKMGTDLLLKNGDRFIIGAGALYNLVK